VRALLFIAALATAAACTSGDSDSTPLRDEAEAEAAGEPEDECKLEGARIGEIGARVHVGDRTIVFEDWVPKVGEPGAYVGFILSTDAEDVSYVVKAGRQRHDVTGTSWAHPDGFAGPDVPGISNVDFCGDDPVVVAAAAVE
jgi:hypothetical protein